MPPILVFVSNISLRHNVAPLVTGVPGATIVSKPDRDAAHAAFADALVTGAVRVV
jgi:hypothetical protein